MGERADAAKSPFETTIGDLLLECAEADPAHTVVVWQDRDLTYALLAEQAKSLAQALAGLGIGASDTVVSMLPNDPDHVVLLLALSLLGGVWVPLNPNARGPSLEHAINVTRPAIALARNDAGTILREAGLDDDCPILDPSTLELRRAGCLPVRNASPDDLRAILFTSGTTGRPKGVMVTERMLIASAAGTALASDCRDGDVFLMWEPLHHIGGSQLIVMALVHRIRLVMVERFSASGFWPQIRTHGINKLHYLGGILEILLKGEPADTDKNHPIELAFGGGCRPQIWRKFEKRFAIPIREVYGMTEASSFTTVNTEGVVGSVGTPVPWFGIELMDQDGSPVPEGSIGEFVISTSHPGLFTPGYLKAPEATAKLNRHGRLHTGDLGRKTGGHFHFVGRMTDSLRRRGENISAWEVETALAGHADIVESAVVGVTAEIGEHEILCYVALRDGATFDPVALAAWCVTAMQPHHVPRYWKQVDGFERTPSQRIRKDLLDRELADVIDTAPGPIKRALTPDGRRKDETAKVPENRARASRRQA